MHPLNHPLNNRNFQNQSFQNQIIHMNNIDIDQSSIKRIVEQQIDKEIEFRSQKDKIKQVVAYAKKSLEGKGGKEKETVKNFIKMLIRSKFYKWNISTSI